MLFSSLFFLFIFFPITLLFYFIGKGNKWRNSVLLVFSLVFYAWGEPVLIAMMIGLTIVNYLFAIGIDKYKDTKKISKTLLILSIIITLCPLIFYKYTDFLLSNINSIFSVKISMLHLALPLGISFYTFQIMSYTIDVYLKRTKVQKNLFYLGTYVALFPQLVAGPIVRYIDVEKELNEERKVTLFGFASGLKRFTFGLAKKLIIANGAAVLADFIFDKSLVSDYSMVLIWTGVVAYTIQIYFDFSGYSDMAIGMGQMFGFNFPENFDYPYSSWSITTFWRKWHMTLGTWFREYVYIPLGGNRVGTIRFIFNVMIVWLVTGFWHGASWNFILWGLWFGVFLLFEKFFLFNFFKKHKYIGVPFTLLVVMIGWVFFRATTLDQAGHMIIAMFNFNKWGTYAIIQEAGILHKINWVIIGVIFSIPWYKKILELEKGKDLIIFKKTIIKGGEKTKTITWWITLTISFALLIVCIGILTYSSYNPFIYFNF